MRNKTLLQPNPLQLITWIPLARGLFLKSPETLRAYFGCHNSFYIFATPRFKAIRPRNLLSFSYVKNMLKDHLFKTSGFQFNNWLFGPEKFSGLSRNRPQASIIIKPRIEHQCFEERVHFSETIWPVFDQRRKQQNLGPCRAKICKLDRGRCRGRQITVRAFVTQ